jgi:hypothetical protein
MYLLQSDQCLACGKYRTGTERAAGISSLKKVVLFIQTDVSAFYKTGASVFFVFRGKFPQHKTLSFFLKYFVPATHVMAWLFFV